MIHYLLVTQNNVYTLKGASLRGGNQNSNTGIELVKRKCRLAKYSISSCTFYSLLVDVIGFQKVFMCYTCSTQRYIGTEIQHLSFDIGFWTLYDCDTTCSAVEWTENQLVLPNLVIVKPNEFPIDSFESLRHLCTYAYLFLMCQFFTVIDEHDDM
jgi:hypothetical protein